MDKKILLAASLGVIAFGSISDASTTGCKRTLTGFSVSIKGGTTVRKAELKTTLKSIKVSGKVNGLNTTITGNQYNTESKANHDKIVDATKVVEDFFASYSYDTMAAVLPGAGGEAQGGAPNAKGLLSCASIKAAHENPNINVTDATHIAVAGDDAVVQAMRTAVVKQFQKFFDALTALGCTITYTGGINKFELRHCPNLGDNPFGAAVGAAIDDIAYPGVTVRYKGTEYPIITAEYSGVGTDLNELLDSIFDDARAVQCSNLLSEIARDNGLTELPALEPLKKSDATATTADLKTLTIDSVENTITHTKFNNTFGGSIGGLFQPSDLFAVGGEISYIYEANKQLLQDPELNKSKFHKIGNTGYAAIYSSEVGKNPTKIEFRPRYEVGASLIAGLTNGSYLAYVTGGITYTGYELTLTPTAGTAPIGYRDLNTESSGSVAIGADDKANTATVTVSTDVIAKDSFAFTADGASTTTVAEQKLKKAVFGARAGVGVLFMLSPHIGPFVECTVGFKRKVDLGASTSYTDCKLEHDLSMFGANHYVNTYDLRVLLGVKVLLF